MIKGKRLSPEVRREQLLDKAKEALAERGLGQFSMKKLAEDAGVSEQLIFHYFGNKTDLLQQLLVRDYEKYLAAVARAMKSAASLEDVVRFYVSLNFEHHDASNIIGLLSGQPEISIAIEQQQAIHRKQRARYLVDLVAKEYGLGRKQAELMTTMASAASIAAADYCHEHEMDREETIDRVMHFMTAGFESASLSKSIQSA